MKKSVLLTLGLISAICFTASSGDEATAPATQSSPQQPPKATSQQSDTSDPFAKTKAPIGINKVLKITPEVINKEMMMRRNKIELKHLIEEVKDEISDLKDEIKDLKSELKEIEDEEIKIEIQQDISNAERRIKAAEEKKIFLKEMEALQQELVSKISNKEEANAYREDIVDSADRYLGVIDEISDLEEERASILLDISRIRKDIEDSIKNEAETSRAAEEKPASESEANAH